MRGYTRRHVSSFRSTAILTISVLAIPLFAAITAFGVYTVRNQQEAVRSSRLSTLSAYQAQLENAIQTAETYLRDTAIINLDFQSIVYAKTKTEAYVAAEAVAKTIRPLLQANELLGSFYTYSKVFDQYRPSNIVSYPSKDAAVIRDWVIGATGKGSAVPTWQPLWLSNRIVLLSAAVFRETVAAAVIDPGKQNYTGLEDGGLIFSVLPDGSLYAPSSTLVRVPIPQAGTRHILFQDATGKKYDAVSLPLPRIGGYIYYAVPEVSPFQQLSWMQNVLLLVTVCLLASIPVCWLMFRRFLLEPLNSLTNTMQTIQKGNTEIRVPQESRIREVNEILEAVNTMLDALQLQKIASYEQRLAMQHAQLQYLQLQIRPHFYLSCLNMIYSMVEEKNDVAIQELVLNLSSYLRGMFRDSARLVSLSTELRSVESYIRIQQVGVQQTPQYKLDLDADVTEALIPPLSILTFVENSFKHNKLIDKPVEIHIQCGKLCSEEGDYLNITISDNCGGIPKDQLQSLNGSPQEMYREEHVGVLNVKQRLRLMYGDKAVLSFRNQTGGTCVDLFIPMDYEAEKDESQ